MKPNYLTPRALLKSEWIWLVGIFLFARLLYSGVGILTLRGDTLEEMWRRVPANDIYQSRTLTVPDWGDGAHLLVDNWYRWDTGWYLKIAALGFDARDGSIIFAPLYPLLIRLIQPILGGHYLLAALLISNASCFAVLVLFYRLAISEAFSTDETRRAVVLLLAFPTGFYLFAAYTEALFLAFVLATFLMAKHKRWLWAGAMATLAALARLNGWILSIPLAWLIFTDDLLAAPGSPGAEVRNVLRALRTRAGWQRALKCLWSPSILAVFLPILAFVGHNLWLYFNKLGTISHAYLEYWGMHIVAPWRWISLVAAHIAQNHAPNNIIDFGLLLLFLFICVAGASQISPSLSLYNLATLGMTMMRGHIFPLAGFSRYMLSFFSGFWILGRWSARRWLFYLLLSSFLIVQSILLWLFFKGLWVA